MNDTTKESPKTPLALTAADYVTDFWNDSCSVDELNYAIANGGVGATTNPSIVLNVLKKELPAWRPTLQSLIDGNPTWNEEKIAWKLIEEMGLKGAGLLMPIFEREKGMKGRISMQTNPANYRDSEALVEQAMHFHSLAPNVQVKIPVTAAGIVAFEEATYRGVTINATVCFTVPQAIAVAEAVERGLKRRAAEGKDCDIFPACTIMVGRLDDWTKVVAQRDGIALTPGYADWAGVASMKKAYGIYKERGYKTRLLAAAYRNHLHWSEFIGGDIILTIPYEWQVLFNNSSVEVKERMHTPVDPKIIAELYALVPDFRRAYDEDGMTVSEFDTFGATARTLRTFCDHYHELLGIVRDVMIPNPDKKK
ncbi:MAG: transaldolase [Treponema sp. GWB1_62_6]|nr:MAG: transaldolase [Treponema sp. GWA1_62_8]OHE67177.1 MAG: transaldolase [Treponema sp. GWC1_61_84]OHE69090.1 MAG: transaldolase [Treponema sp. RIFOXYC1_FULL_61_9]OHE71444.1 MAG: transaldolase [Treponema sp. GWB1_62_6]HCM24933.1 transaldolase [Treponema sp.]